jgi:hypothetical protein
MRGDTLTAKQRDRSLREGKEADPLEKPLDVELDLVLDDVVVYLLQILGREVLACVPR